ncbi:Lrp/AsnC ligand binding domain-containing protein [Hoeflea prorocentri]|uniref:Lrp/AsnC ligand binding domain-containing protein n=1 Tax=Hoeflea prorocentri TaxID=1922333 RepID=A0A9X3ZG38_9HYPH|nr:Lrp/AsnC ligand binding domain-containing protein [Hoeflea prorocentri]MCY6379513.1 Lrp/AsnC ligand binding domain-containing protein [Hoeflea prorocentri]MDA5397313.1 Lrp/AsnC ligand binding domain-containing protein [Hoeflea prorocentri]
MKSIDQTDRKILRLLQRQGRLSNLELAEKVHLSPTATAERVKRLVREGFVEGYSARLSPEKLGRGLLVFVEVKLDRTTDDVFEAFAEAVKRSDDVMECHMVAGGFDYLVKARVGGMAAYRAFLSEVILPLPGIRETHTYAVMEEVKSSSFLPV